MSLQYASKPHSSTHVPDQIKGSILKSRVPENISPSSHPGHSMPYSDPLLDQSRVSAKNYKVVTVRDNREPQNTTNLSFGKPKRSAFDDFLGEIDLNETEKKNSLRTNQGGKSSDAKRTSLSDVLNEKGHSLTGDSEKPSARKENLSGELARKVKKPQFVDHGGGYLPKLKPNPLNEILFTDIEVSSHKEADHSSLHKTKTNPTRKHVNFSSENPGKGSREAEEEEINMNSNSIDDAPVQNKKKRRGTQFISNPLPPEDED